MSGESQADSALRRWYQNHIGEPTTNDEVQGYWMYVMGVLLGVLGIVLFLISE